MKERTKARLRALETELAEARAEIERKDKLIEQKGTADG